MDVNSQLHVLIKEYIAYKEKIEVLAKERDDVKGEILQKISELSEIIKKINDLAK